MTDFNSRSLQPIMKELIRYQLKEVDNALSNNDTSRALNLLRLAELETSTIGQYPALFLNLGPITHTPFADRNILSDIMKKNPSSDENEFVMQFCFRTPSAGG